MATFEHDFGTNQLVLNMHLKRGIPMGFWANTKTVLSSTGKGLSNGMNLLAEGAVQFERMSSQVLLKTTIMTLESKRKNLGDEWFLPENAEDHQKLVDSYSESLRTALPDHSSDVQAKLDKLYADQRSLAISKKIGKIQSLTGRLESSKFKLAINAIDARRELIYELNELIKFHSIDSQNPIFEQAKSQKPKLEAEIIDLEPARRTTHTTFHASGSPKVSAVRFDGKLNELYESWHENGNVRWRIPFDAGQPVGIAKHWRDNGTLSLSATFDKRLLSITMSSRNAEPLAYIQIRDKFLHVELLPQEVKGIKLTLVRDKPLSKLAFALKILNSTKSLKFIWNTRRPGRASELMEELTIYPEELKRGMAELQSISSTGHKLPRSIHKN